MRHIAGDFDDSRLVLKDYISVLKKHVGTAVRYELSQKARQDRVRRVNIELRAADLIIVSNQHDVDALVREGISKSNITKLPFGLTDERRNQLVRVAGNSTGTPTITFVGTFDFRKGGATDIPRIVDQVLSEHPEVKMRLLGTRGLFVSEREVLSHFAPRVQSRVEVVPRYDPDTLPELLLGSTLGIFPSRYEGFPFGVLEMLAAGLPVFAYHSPGPPEMLPGEWLSERGDWKGLADSATRLLHDRQTLSRLKQEALSRAQRFKWDQIAEETLAAYTTKLESA
ncbi:hypothetical protein CRI94_13980 [Longibacter salinarum]|uniref:Glycosyl transferase family 1 domain-containing protein n=1 Tax=Longibacter salinarum TaxID=1850348 RepID=A0A2A8CVI3_9BACT|nr:hypothetical protein CRI94_13980 [Longibacter salinarum]